VGHAPAESLLAAWQGTDRQGPQGGALVALEAYDRRLMRRPMDALIGDDHPLGQMALERGERLEVELREAIALDVFNACFGLALGPRTIRGACARLDIPVPTEREIRRVKDNGARRATRPNTNARALSPRTVRGTPPKCVKAAAMPSRQSSWRSLRKAFTNSRRE